MKRRVSFNEQVLCVEPDETRNSLDPRTAWMQASDFDLIKQEALETGVKVRSFQARHCENPLTYTNVFTRVYESCQVQLGPGPVDLEQLAHWIELQPARRGLERHLLTDLSLSRSERILNHRLAILRLQACTKLHKMSPEDASDILCTRSSQITKPEAMYAHSLAKADEIARIQCHHRYANSKGQNREEAQKPAKLEHSVGKQNPCKVHPNRLPLLQQGLSWKVDRSS